MRSARESGVSLLEIIIAMQLMALLLALLCRVLPLARRQVREADRRLGGAVLAQNTLEEYLVVPLADWPRNPIRGQGYDTLLEATPWEEDGRMLLVTVSVLSGDEEQYRLQTLVVKP